MARNTTRVGRRRRVLNEEVLSASNIPAYGISEATAIEPGDTPRYGAGANIENHPQVTSFVPRRYRTLSAIALISLGVGATAELIAYYAQSLSELTQVITTTEITNIFANRLVAWTSATLLLLTAAYARLIFSLRRHRIDDYRGRYRVWRTASLAAVVLSLNAVLGLHEPIARVLGNLVNYQILPASAGWWLIPATLLGGWLLVKLTIDSAECRATLATYFVAIACLTFAGLHSAGWSPAWIAQWPEALSRTLPLAGYTFALVGTLLFARYVILDVQGLIEHPISEASTISQVEVTISEPIVETEKAPKKTKVAKIAQAATQEPDASDWVDGSEPEYDEHEGRHLSKAQRKRLRKQQKKRRAA